MGNRPLAAAAAAALIAAQAAWAAQPAAAPAAHCLRSETQEIAEHLAGVGELVCEEVSCH